MKKLVILVIIVQSLFIIVNGYTENYCQKSEPIINHVLKQIKAQKQVKFIEVEHSNDGWMRVELDWYLDMCSYKVKEKVKNQYPLTIDLLFNTNPRIKTEKIMYLIAPSGLNFKNTFFVPHDKNISHYIRKHGYLVIGITFPEDHIPADKAGAFMADWGLEKHRRELEAITQLIGSFIPLKFDMLGQESSAVCIMDYAAHSRGMLNRIILLDTDSFDPAIQPEKVQYARITHNAFKQLISEGVYISQFTRELKQMIIGGTLYPDMDSGVARDFLGLPGNFTLNGLLHFSLIHTASLPGIHTPLTGLPGEWVMLKGLTSGYYFFSGDPLQDDYGLIQTRPEHLLAMANEASEGTLPLAISKDIYAVIALNNAEYSIPWEGIKETVIMINGQYSSGEQTYYGTLIKRNGNPNVRIHVIPNYAYLDLLHGEYAEQDVWYYIF